MQEIREYFPKCTFCKGRKFGAGSLRDRLYVPPWKERESCGSPLAFLPGNLVPGTVRCRFPPRPASVSLWWRFYSGAAREARFREIPPYSPAFSVNNYLIKALFNYLILYLNKKKRWRGSHRWRDGWSLFWQIYIGKSDRYFIKEIFNYLIKEQFRVELSLILFFNALIK